MLDLVYRCVYISQYIRSEIESDGYISSNNDNSSDDVVVSSDFESGWSDNFDDSTQTIITTPPHIPQPGKSCYNSLS